MAPGSERDVICCKDTHLATLLPLQAWRASLGKSSVHNLDDGAPVKVGTDSDEAEDDLCPVPGDSESSTVTVNPGLGKIRRYLRGSGTDESKSDGLIRERFPLPCTIFRLLVPRHPIPIWRSFMSNS